MPLNQTELSRASPLKRWLFNLAKSQKAAMIQKGIVTNNTIWDRLVFAKAQQQLGGKVRLIGQIWDFSNRFMIFACSHWFCSDCR